MKELRYDGSPFDVATVRDLGSLPQGQATQNPVATGAAIFVTRLYFGAWSAKRPSYVHQCGGGWTAKTLAERHVS